MSWFSRKKAPKPVSIEDKYQVPNDVWAKCPGCSAILYTKELKRNLSVCPKCEYHFRLNAPDRIELLVDRHSFVEVNAHIHQQSEQEELEWKGSQLC